MICGCLEQQSNQYVLSSLFESACSHSFIPNLSSLDSYYAAMVGARKVQITYQDEQPPIINIKEAVERKSFFPKQLEDLVKGDVEGECSIHPLRSVRFQGSIWSMKDDGRYNVTPIFIG